MTPHEAAELLTLMRGTWPRLAPDEIADRLWLEDLVTLDRQPALEAFRTLRNTESNSPKWALFLEAYQARARGRAAREIEAPAPEGWGRPTDEQRRRVRALVDGLSKQLTGRAPRPFPGDEVF